MTKQHNTNTDSMTRAEYMAYIAKVYDVPMTLIRYEQTYNNDRAGTGTSGVSTRDDS